MSNDLTTLRLEDGGWQATVGTSAPRRVTFDPTAWANTATRLGPDAVASYRTLARAEEYAAWWADACGGGAPGVRRFLLRTTPNHWERPWEATIATLDNARWPDISIVRAVDEEHPIPERPALDAALRILWLSGAAAVEGYATLDLAAEADGLEATRERLDAAAKARVEPIIRREAHAEGLTEDLIEVRPNVLWFSGHGRADPPGLLLADQTWLAPDTLAAAVSQATAQGADIRYVVLWACRSGLMERFSAPGSAPPFIDALSRAGVSAVLATQAPLEDAFAGRLAGAIFSGLAGGQPLDHAIARARGNYMLQEGQDRDDWVCPVVWAADLPADRLELAVDMAAALRQDLAYRLLPSGWMIEAPSATATAHGHAWVGRKIWVESPSAGTSEVRKAWLTRVLAMQSTAGRAVLVLDLTTAAVGQALKQWADEVARRVSHAEDPDKSIRRAAEALKLDVETGWSALCQRDDVLLAFAAPIEAPNWFWDGLAAAPAAVALANEISPARAAEGWRADRLEADPVEDIPGFALDDPEFTAFAVLGAPAARPDVEAAAPGRLDGWLDAGWVIETQSGFVMPFARAQAVAGRLSADQMKAAHDIAFAYLDGLAAAAKLADAPCDLLRQARLAHALATGRAEAISSAADALLRQYRLDRRWSAYRGVFEQVSNQFRTLDPCHLVAAARSFIDTGAPREALDWLDIVHDDDLDADCAAWRAMLRAEALKASGQADSKARAREVLLDVQAQLADEPNLDGWRLRIRHDLAWQTHFLDHAPAAVLDEYAEIERAWQTIPGAGIDRAIVLRNLVEAQMTVASEAEPPDHGLLERAETNLAAARYALPPNCAAPVVSELEYVAGRLALRRGNEGVEIESRFRRCLTLANSTSYLMMAAIVDARLYWIAEDARGGPFDPEGWRLHREALAAYVKHGWAARVTINGDLRSAFRLAREDAPRMAVPHLRRAQTLLASNPAFDRGGDRQRHAAAFAGLALFAPDAEPWPQFRVRFAWADDWLRNRLDTAEAVWEEGPP